MIRRLVLLMLLAMAVPAHAKLSPNDIARAGAHPSPDARIPGDTMWTDQRGGQVRLGDLVDGKPTVLLFVDYTCQHICGPGLTLTSGALADGEMRVGEDNAFVILGLDPKDGPDEARAMAARRLSSLPEVARHVELLSADPQTVKRAKKALGFTTVYDAETDQYAHDASAYIFNGQGHLTKLLPETALTPSMLEKALHSAGAVQQNKGFLAHITTVCYGFAAAHGLYGNAILWGLQAGGVLILVAGALFFFLMFRKRRRDAA